MSDKWRTRRLTRRATGIALAACLFVAGSPLGASAAPPSPTLSISDVTLTEPNSGTTNAVFTVTLAKPPRTGSVTVNYATANGTATQPADYTSRSGSLTLSKASPTATVSVPVVGDTLDEANETFTVVLSGAVGATIKDGTGLGTITDNDAPPTLAINDVAVLEGNSGTNTATFTVSLSTASSFTVGVNYATANGTAAAPSDYATASGSLSFAPGETSKTIDVTVKGDTTDEGNETYGVNLSGASNATIADGSGVGTITNDDVAPTISIDDVSVTEGDSGTATATFTVSLSSVSSRTITVDYQAASGTATKPGDFAGTSGTLTFAAGDTSMPVSVTVNGDSLSESDENFFVNLSNPTRATIADGSGLGTISNDDPLPSLSVADATPVNETNTGSPTASFTVDLSTASGQTVTVNYATMDGTALAPDDYTAKSGTLTFSAGQTTKTVQVTLKGDVLDEDDETLTLDLSGETNATVTDGSGLGTITDDDATPSLAIADVAVAEGDSGTRTATFTVSLSAASGRTVTVDYATADGTAAAGADYASAAGTATFLAGETSQTIDVTVNGDTSVEGDETFLVDLSGETNATVADSQATGTVLEDDSSVTISVADVSLLEGNTGAKTMSFVVSLSGPRGVPVTVDYATSDGTATQPADYASASGTLIFAPGETSKTVGVTIQADTTDEPDETLTLDLANPASAAIADGQGVGSILDNDKGPVTLSVKVRKKGTTANVKGVLSPAHAGKRLTVTLSKLAGGRYKKVSSKKAKLGSPVDTNGDGVMDSRYATKFAALADGKYKVTVKWGGDPDHFGKTVSKTFKM